MKREVTDILDAGGGLVAFNQELIGGKEYYEAVCPWCTDTLEKRITPPKTKQGDSITFGEIYTALLGLQIPHMATCRERLAHAETDIAVMNVFCKKRR